LVCDLDGGCMANPNRCGYLDGCDQPGPDTPGDCVPAEQLGFGDPCQVAEGDPLGPCPLAMSCIDGKCQTRPWFATCQ
jgi:hypothetical protein